MLQEQQYGLSGKADAQGRRDATRNKKSTGEEADLRQNMSHSLNSVKGDTGDYIGD